MSLNLAELPAPEITTPYSYYDQDRSRHAEYYLQPKPEKPGDKSQSVQISVSHDKNRKCFYALAYHVEHEKGEQFSAVRYDLMDGVRIASEPVARFSKKGLEAFVVKVVEAFPAQVAASPKLQSFFEVEQEEE